MDGYAFCTCATDDTTVVLYNPKHLYTFDRENALNESFKGSVVVGFGASPFSGECRYLDVSLIAESMRIPAENSLRFVQRLADRNLKSFANLDEEASYLHRAYRELLRHSEEITSREHERDSFLSWINTLPPDLKRWQTINTYAMNSYGPFVKRYPSIEERRLRISELLESYSIQGLFS